MEEKAKLSEKGKIFAFKESRFHGISIPKKVSRSKTVVKNLFQNPEFPSRLELYNTPTAPLQMGNTPPMSVLVMTLNNLMVRLQ